MRAASRLDFHSSRVVETVQTRLKSLVAPSGERRQLLLSRGVAAGVWAIQPYHSPTRQVDVSWKLPPPLEEGLKLIAFSESSELQKTSKFLKISTALVSCAPQNCVVKGFHACLHPS
eukprot:scaffold503_cov375-Pinguiococcus_pyrenoidosus.AAC.26